MLKRIGAFAASFVLSISSLLVLAPAVVHAVTDICTWSGAVDNTFNDTGNWTCSIDGAAIPENGDTLVFDNTALSASETLTNDIVGLSVAAINVTGSNPGFFGYTITDEDVTLTGNISNTSNHSLDFTTTAVTLGANVSFTGTGSVYLGDLNVSTFDLNVANFTSVTGILSGSGDITVSVGESFSLGASPNTFTGSFIVNGYINVPSPASIATANSITVADDSQIYFDFFQAPAGVQTISTPITLNGDGTPGTNPMAALVVSFDTDTGDVTFDDLTLGADSTYGSSGTADQKTVVTATLNGHTLSRIAGSQGKLTVNDVAIDSAYKTYTFVSPTDDYAGAGYTWTIGDKTKQVFNNQTTANPSVLKGGIIMGKGKVGNVSLADGAKLAPGESPGCLSTGNLTLVAGSTYEYEIAGTTECTEYDQTKVTGTVTLGNGTLQITHLSNFKPAAGQTYKVVDNDAADPVIGTFLNLAHGAEVSVGGYVYTISYTGGDGNDVVLTVKNVPTTPNTGFELLTAHPIITMITTTLLAAGIALIARRYSKLTSTR